MIEISTPMAVLFVVVVIYATVHNFASARRIMHRQRPTQSNGASWLWMMVILAIGVVILWGGK